MTPDQHTLPMMTSPPFVIVLVQASVFLFLLVTATTLPTAVVAEAAEAEVCSQTTPADPQQCVTKMSASNTVQEVATSDRDRRIRARRIANAKAAAAHLDCGVYMAPSTVGNHSNLGIYTGIALPNGASVPYPEILIPMLWRIFGEHPAAELSKNDGELWDRYIWEQHVGQIEVLEDTGPQRRSFQHEKASCFIPGVGCTVNSMLDLSNIISATGSDFDELVSRANPGAGAFTPYHGTPTIIRSPFWSETGDENEDDLDDGGVEAGQELFASYGDEWIPHIPNVAVTFSRNFQKADVLMEDFQDWIKQHDGVSDAVLNDMWSMMLDFPHHGAQHWEELSVLPRVNFTSTTVPPQQQPPTTNTTNRTTNHFPTSSSPSTRYWVDTGKASVAFLQEHGKCQDHLRPDISNIPHAGRGAFATRDLPKGTVVGFAPLVHVAFHGAEIYEVTYNGESKHGLQRSTSRYDEEMDPDLEEAETNSEERYTKPDLIVNYSFGHADSPLHLTPYGSIVNYINHQSSHRNSDSDSGSSDADAAGDAGGPNVRVQWPTTEFVSFKPDWLTQDLSFLRDTIDKIGLSFDYVALRDIRAGEEVTMDYGDDWDAAWQEHVTNWIAPPDADGYIHSTKFSIEYLRTRPELELTPYPWNLHTLCTGYYHHDDEDDEDDPLVYDDSLLGQEQYQDKYPCTVLERHLSNTVDEEDENDDDEEEDVGTGYVYTVEIEVPDFARDNEDDDNDHAAATAPMRRVRVHGYPHQDDGIALYDKAYSQHWHMKEAFRHKLAIPDDMMPASWKL